jgi:hypothetical protein
MKFHGSSEALLDQIPVELQTAFPEIHVYAVRDGGPQGQGPSVFVDESLEPNQVVDVITKKDVNHVVQKNQGRFEGSLISTGRLVSALGDYFLSEYCFFIDPLQDSLKIDFRGPSDKLKIKQNLFSFAEKTKSLSVQSSADAVVEELYMNAVFDAPREAARRGQPVVDQACEIFLARNAHWFQISCTDPYGSLEVRRFLARMSEVYSRGAGEAINLTKTGGAGLGCVILFEHSSCLILGVDPGVRTKVTCLIPLGISNRNRSQMRKSLHWFEL